MFSRKFKKVGPVWVLVVFVAVVGAFTLFKREKNKDMVDIQEMFPNEAAVRKEFEQVVLEDQKKQKLKDPIPSPAIVSELEQKGEAPFVIQAYSFQNKTRAEAIVSILKSQGYPAYILMSDLGEKGVWYRVRVGEYKNQKQAQQVLEQLKKDEHDGFITRK